METSTEKNVIKTPSLIILIYAVELDLVDKYENSNISQPFIQ